MFPIDSVHTTTVDTQVFIYPEQEVVVLIIESDLCNNNELSNNILNIKIEKSWSC